MQLEHSFSVPVGIDEAWRILIDIERIGPCLPGAAIDSVDGDEFTGTVKVKLGPINLTYKGKARFVEKDEATHRAVIDARGRDARGNGTAAAKVTATLHGEGESTSVRVDTDLDITGKPAQFGRGVMVDVGSKLLGQFADALAETIRGGDSTSTPPAGSPAGTETTAETAGTAGTGTAAAPRTRPKPPAKAAAKASPTKASPAKASPTKASPTKATQAKATQAKATPLKATSGEAAEPTEPVEAPEPTAPSSATPDAAPASPAVTDPAPPTGTDSDSPTDSPTDRPTDRDTDTHTDTDRDPEPISSGAPDGHSMPGRAAARDVEPIDLLHHAGPALAKRLAPLAVAAVVVLLAVRRRSTGRG